MRCLQEWDISSLSKCKAGIGCPVSETFTDDQFEVPMGCNSMSMQVTQNGGRGGSPQQQVPSVGNGYRGEITIDDRANGGATVYDIDVTLTCNGGESSEPASPMRLSCTHDFGIGGTGGVAVPHDYACRMGRIEVYNPQAEHPGHSTSQGLSSGGMHSSGGVRGSWGSVCGFRYFPGGTPQTGVSRVFLTP